MKISIITPTFNGERYILETITSVQRQRFTDYEHIIIDNGSTDGTNHIIQHCAKSDKRILHIQNKNNKGIVGGRNQGLTLANGEYLCFLDQDDIRKDEDKLSKQIRVLDTEKEYGIIGSFFEYIDESSKIIGKMAYQQDDKDIREKILKYNQFCTCSVMIRKSVIDKIGPLNAKYEKVDDYELRLRSGLISKFYNIPEYLVQYRKYIGNTSTNNKNYLQMKNLHFKLTRKYYKKYPNGYSSLLFSGINSLIPYKLAEYIKRSI